MNQTELICIPEEIKSEFSVAEDGKAFASRRATARLCGLKDHGSIRNLLKNVVGKNRLSSFLEPFAGQDYTDLGVGEMLPDSLVAAIIMHYAEKGREQAQKTLLAFAAIGIRIWIQQELNWQAPELAIESEKIKQLKADNEQLDKELGISTEVAFGWFLTDKKYQEEEARSKRDIDMICTQLAELLEESQDFQSKYDSLVEKYNV